MLLTKFRCNDKKFSDYISNKQNKIIDNDNLRNDFIKALYFVSRNHDLLFRAKYVEGDNVTILQVWKSIEARKKFESMYDHEKLLLNFSFEWSFSEKKIESIDYKKLLEDVSKHEQSIVQVDISRGISL